MRGYYQAVDEAPLSKAKAGGWGKTVNYTVMRNLSLVSDGDNLGFLASMIQGYRYVHEGVWHHLG